MTAIKNDENEEMDLLGYLTWYSVGKQLVEAKELEIKLKDAGLDSAWMPKPIRSADAFRRATKEIEQRKATSNPSVFENILIREVYSDKELIQRNMVIETVDQHGKRLSYDSKAGIITLDKKNNRLTFTVENSMAQELSQEVERKFVIYRSHYAAQQVRVMVNSIMQSLAPTPVRKNGGIYFVPDSKSMELAKLVQFISSLDNSEGYKIPVIDSMDNRHMVNKKLLDHLKSVLAECRNSNRLSKGQIKVLIDEANGMIKNHRNYKSIVTDESARMEKTIATIRSEISRMVTEI